MSKWEKVQLGSIAKIQGGYAFKSKKFMKGEVPIIRIGNIDSLKVELDYNVCYPEKFWIENEAYRVKSGDILIAMSGATVGKIGKFTHDVPALLNQRVGLIRVDDKKVYPKYIYQYVKSNIFLKQIQQLSLGCAQPNISAKQIESILLPLPSYKEQKQTADNFESIEEILARHKQQHIELDNLIKSIFHDMFGDLTTNEKEWHVVNYSNILSGKPKNGFFAKNDMYCENGNAEVIWISDFIDKMSCQLSDLKRVRASDDDIIKYSVAYGDMLFCRSSLTKAGIGKCSFVPQEVRENTLFECHIIKTKVNLDLVNPVFLQVQTTTDYFRNQIISQSKTSTMTTIGQQGIIDNKIILPPISIQKQYAEKVGKIQDQKSLVQKAINATQNLFDSLMAKYFD